jgi:4-amino-4-deoxy-L-arabinose transferase-like glycosyltransferase
MSTRLRIYGIISALLALSYWCNNLPQPEHRRLLGAILIMVSVLCLEWVIKSVARDALRQAAQGADQ